MIRQATIDKYRKIHEINISELPENVQTYILDIEQALIHTSKEFDRLYGAISNEGYIVHLDRSISKDK